MPKCSFPELKTSDGGAIGHGLSFIKELAIRNLAMLQ